MSTISFTSPFKSGGSIKHHIKSAALSVAGTVLRTATHRHLPTLGGHIVNVPRDMDSHTCVSIALGRYEQAEIDIVKKYFKPAKTIIEIGSNIGVVAQSAFSKKLQDKGTYICVEPNPISQAVLATNMARVAKHYRNRQYEIVSAAICRPDQDGTSLSFYSRSDLSSGLAGQVRKESNDHVIIVSARSFGSIVDQFAQNGASLICDAEGAEITMLKKNPEAFSRITQIAIELHDPKLTGQPVTPEDMLNEFRAIGFSPRHQIRNCYYLDRK